MELSVETSGLTKRYGSVRAVSELPLEVPKGSVYGFLGPNGSGKTTTLRMLVGLIRPGRGKITLNGLSLSRQRGKALAEVGALLEQPALYPAMTGRKNLELACVVEGISKDRIDPILEQVGLTHAANRKAKGYSLGMRQRLAIGRALLGEPKLLILDEPTNGLDPSGIAEVRELIKSLPAASGATVLLSSHLLAEVELMADHVGLIREGELVFQGTLEALKAKAGSSLYIEATSPETVLNILSTEDLQATVDGTWVTARADLSRLDRAALLEKLVTAGAGVSHFELRAANLESLFLDLTSTTRKGADA